MKKIFTLLLLTGSLTFAAVISGTPAPETREYESLNIDKIHIENTSGKVTIVPMLVNKIEVSAIKHKFPEKCTFVSEKSDYSELIVRVEKPIGQECEVDLEIKVPKEVDLNIWSGSGNISIAGTEGNLTFNVGSGSVTASGKFKKVEGKAGSGNVDLTGLTGGGNISVGSGLVNLRFLNDPMGRMDVKTGSGDAQIKFPKGSKISASLETGSGKVINELGSSEAAGFGISVKTGSGDLKVQTY